MYLGLWGDVGEMPAKVLSVYGLNMAVDVSLEKDPNVVEIKKLASEAITEKFGRLTLLMHALMGVMEGKTDMMH